MNYRIAVALGLSLAISTPVLAQPGAQPGYYPAAPGPIMAVPGSVLFAEPQASMMPAGPMEPPVRYPVDENGNRAINWFYSQSDFLFGWSQDKGGRTLATTGDTFGRGVIGESGTSSLGSVSKFDSTFGFRQTVGYWITPSRTFGFEASGFTYQRKTAEFGASSGADGQPVLARPFYDATTNAENARLIAFPGAFAGNISASGSQRVYGADAGFVINAIERESYGIDFLAGFKFMTLLESVDTADFSQALGGGLLVYNGTTYAAPAAITTQDHVSTANRFYGPSLGLRFSGDFDRVSYTVSARCGLGWVRQSQATSGSTALLSDGVNVASTSPTGMMYFPSNSGVITRTVFAALPELSVKLGYRITKRMTVSVGYDLMYLSNAVRPGDTTNLAINPNLLPTGTNFGVPFGPNAPTGSITSSNFLMHTLTGGIVVVF